MSNWKSYKYSPKRPGGSINNSAVPIVLLIVFIGFIFLAYIGITTFVKNLDKIGIKQEETAGKTRIENIQPPLLSNIPRYSKEKVIMIEGYSVEKAKITLYKNNKMIKELETRDDGDFKFENIVLDSGDNEFYATSTVNEKTSIASSKLLISVDTTSPVLTISSPEKDSEVEVNESDELITVTGTTDNNIELNINGRLASIDEDGAFSVSINVKEGKNSINAEATDQAGNKTKVEFDFTVKFTKSSN